MLGGEQTRREIIGTFQRPKRADAILDVGCGSASLLPGLLDTSYTGIDLNPRHIEAARQRYGNRATFYCGTLDSLAAEVSGPFDLAMCIGVLHHIDDVEVGNLFQLVQKRLKNNGRFVAIDPAFVDGQNPVARWLASRDSGQAVRTPEGYASLARKAFKRVDVVIRHDLLRVPYTHCIIEASNG